MSRGGNGTARKLAEHLSRQTSGLPAARFATTVAVRTVYLDFLIGGGSVRSVAA